MLGIRLRSTFLSLEPDTRITIEWDHPMDIITDGQDIISSGFSVPIDIPMDDVNIGIIGPVHRLDFDGTYVKDEYCELWCMGTMLYVGKATIKGTTHTRASLFIIFNEVKPLEDTPLSEIDLGGSRDIGADEAAIKAHMKDTAVSPLDYDYVFCPVLNPVYGIDPSGLNPSLITSHLINKWIYGSDAFQGSIGRAIPFPRLDYLLSRIWHHLEYDIDNQWQATDELRLLLLWSNREIRTTEGDLSSTLDLVDHVPYRSCIDLLKAVLSTYAIGVFPDPVSRSVLLRPFADIIRDPVHQDITHLAGAVYEADQDQKYISQLRYDIDTDDALCVDYSGVTFNQSAVIDEGLTVYDLADEPVLGICYVQSENAYYLMGASSPDLEAFYLLQDQKKVQPSTDGQEYISPMIPMWSSWALSRNGWHKEDPGIDPFPLHQEMLVPHIRMQGYSLSSDWLRRPQIAFRTMLYRGLQPYDEGVTGTYPMAGVTRYNIRGEQVGDLSLLWDVPGGIYETYWQPVYEMMRTARRVTRQMRFDIAFLLQFRWYQKYRIENQNVFFTRLRFELSHSGISTVETTMLTAP